MRLMLAVVIGALSLAGFADEQTRQVQEELRKRNLYFGEIDGRKSDELTKALQRYQQRKGFAATGSFDGDTLGSLHVSPTTALAQAVSVSASGASAPATQPWPDVPVLKSDVPRRIKEEDRKFLEEREEAEDAPAAVEKTPPLQPLPAPPLEPTDSRPPGPKAPTKPERVTEAALTPDRVEAFVRSYLSACESNQLRDELAFYADHVKYFDQGVVDRSFIDRDVAAFYRRWPERSYELLDCKPVSTHGDEAVVQFRIAFHYHGPQHRVSGRTENTFSVKQTPGGMKFTALKEQRIRGA